MRFDIYSRFHLEVVREHGEWIAYRVSLGKRYQERDAVIPSDVPEGKLAEFLDDLYHELAKPGDRVTVIE